MNPTLYRGLLLTATLLMPAASTAETGTGFSATCMKQTQETRAMLQDVPPAAQPTRKLVELFVAPEICACMDTDQSRLIVTDSSDPEIQLLAANASCTSVHVASEFPRQCPEIYRDLLAPLGYGEMPEEALAALCECASREMTQTLTPRAVMQAQYAQFRHFKALVRDRQNQTNEAEALRPGPDAFDTAISGMKACVTTVVGPPSKFAAPR